MQNCKRRRLAFVLLAVVLFWCQIPLAAALLDENFATDVFSGGAWIASSPSVAVDVANGWLRIGSNGVPNDYAEISGPFSLPLTIEWRERTVDGAGSYVSLPKLEFWWGLSAAESYHITYVQDDQSGDPNDDGWLFGSWTQNHALAPASWNEWRTVRAIIRSDGGRLFAKEDGDSYFTPLVSKTWAIPNALQHIRVSQHTDDISDFDYIRISSFDQGDDNWCEGFEDEDAFLAHWSADRCCPTVTQNGHSGSAALALGGNSDSCLQWVYRTAFQASAGEYSGWIYLANSHTGGQLYFLVQDDPDTHPQYRPGYAIDVNAVGASPATFWLIRTNGACGGGCYDILGTLNPNFSVNQWVRIVARVDSSGIIIAGYDIDNISGLTDSLILQEQAPISTPGRFYITGCSETGEPKNLWDDVCFTPLSEGPETGELAVDIKPGSCPNPLNVSGDDPSEEDISSGNTGSGGKGGKNSSEVNPAQEGKHKAVLPVAVLGTAEFDVTQIDVTSLHLVGVPALRSSLEDVASPVTNPDACACTDAGPDGYSDLTLKFLKSDVVSALGSVYNHDMITVTLTGNLMDGTPLEGEDCMVIVGGEARPPDVQGGERFAIGLPTEFELGDAFPNPFNPTTKIGFALPQPSQVKLEVFNSIGQWVACLVDDYRQAGHYTTDWSASSQASGIYLYRLTTDSFVETKKMLLLK